MKLVKAKFSETSFLNDGTPCTEKAVQRKIVYGYIHEIEQKLKEYSTVYEIPHSIINFCFSYYYIEDGHIKRIFKSVMLGHSSVGKTSIMNRFVKSMYVEYIEATIGAAFMTQSVIVHDYTIKYELWDTAGQERYRSLSPMYYRGASIAIIVFDVTNKETFIRAKEGIEELDRNCGLNNIEIGVAANKCDLKDQYEVDMKEIKEYAQEKGFILMETSAKCGIGVVELFEQVGMFYMAYILKCLYSIMCLFIFKVLKQRQDLMVRCIPIHHI